MIEENSNAEQAGQKETARKHPLLAIVFLYALGIYIIRKSDFDSGTVIGIIMLVFAWLCVLFSMTLSTMSIIRIFKETIKKK